MGGESVMTTLVGRGKYLASGRNRRVPARDTGMIGALVTTAALKAPSWNGRTASYQREQNLQSGRGEASRFLVILDKLHHHPGRNNPKQKHQAEIHTVQNLESTF